MPLPNFTAAWGALWDAKARPSTRGVARPTPARTGYGGFLSGLGINRVPPGSQYDFQREVGEFRDNSVVAICTRWLARQMLQAELKIGKRNPEGEFEEIDTPQTRAILQMLTKRPNPWMSARQFWEGVIGDYAPNANGYVYKARNANGNGIPVELYWRPAKCITVVTTNERDKPVDYYLYQSWAIREPYQPEDVIHLRDNPDPDQPALGRGRVREQVRNVAALNAGERWTSAVLRNGHGGKVMSPKVSASDVIAGGAPDEADLIAAERSIRMGTTGESAGRIVPVTLPVDLLDIGDGPEKMLIDRILDRPEAMVCAAMGCNSMALDLPSSAGTRTYANRGEARRAAWEEGVIPLQDAVADDMTAQLLSEFDPTGEWVFFWDRENVPALRDDADQRSSRATGLFQATVVTRNEAREIAGAEPIEGADGDLYYGDATERQQQQAADAMAQQQGMQDGTTDPTDPTTEDPTGVEDDAADDAMGG